MEAHRTEATVGGDGSVTVHGLPFPAGEPVDVIVLPAPDHGKVSASDRPAAERARRQAGSAKGLVTVPDDFDEPLDDFKPHM